MFLLRPANAFMKAQQPVEVLSYSAEAHVLHGRYPDGTLFTDTNFWITMAKRCGFTLTNEVPPEFRS